MKKAGLAGVIAVSMAAGAGAQRLKAGPVLATTAQPVAMRWLDEGAEKGAARWRFALTIATSAGANRGGREIVCEADGTGPKLNGVAIADAAAVSLCSDMAAFAGKASSAASALSDLLNQ
ncbi:MAG: hypothetical protein ABI445_24275 [Polyangia bacterium]